MRYLHKSSILTIYTKLYTYIIVLVLGSICCYTNSQAQTEEQEQKLLQFSGMVISGDTSNTEIQPVFYCHVQIKNKRRGTISNLDGLFSIVASPNDTILFSSLGFKPNYLVIPDTIQDNKFSVIHIMEPDVFQLDEVTIYPWPTREKFRQDFLALDIKDDPITVYEKTFGKTIPLEYIPPRGDMSSGVSYVVSGPITAIANFIRDGDKRRLNRYRKKLGILDSVQQEQRNIQVKEEKTFLEQLQEDFPFQNSNKPSKEKEGEGGGN